MTRRVSLLFALASATLAQREDPDPFHRDTEPKLPDGKSQKDAIVKADHKKNQEESVKLAQLANELRDELAEQESHVVSVKMLKKLDEIERLTRNIRTRLKRN